MSHEGYVIVGTDEFVRLAAYLPLGIFACPCGSFPPALWQIDTVRTRSALVRRRERLVREVQDQASTDWRRAMISRIDSLLSEWDGLFVQSLAPTRMNEAVREARVAVAGIFGVGDSVSALTAADVGIVNLPHVQIPDDDAF